MQPIVQLVQLLNKPLDTITKTLLFKDNRLAFQEVLEYNVKCKHCVSSA